MTKKELTAEEKEKHKINIVVIIGTLFYTLIGIGIVFACKSLLLKSIGILIIAYSIFQLIFVLAHKKLSKNVSRFLIIMNFIPYFLYSFCSY